MAELRAYVFLDDATVSTDGTTFFIEYRVKNNGQTPAYNVRVLEHAFVGPYHLEEVPEYPPDSLDNYGVIAPNGDAVDDEVEVAVPKGGINAIQKGRKALYLLGRIDYEDAFHRPQWTEFRFFFADEEIDDEEQQMWADITGNDAS